MDDKYIPYFVHEGIVTRMERQSKRLFVLCLILIILFTGSNVGWLIYESQYEDFVLTQETSSDGGGDAIANGVTQGDIIYGESKTDN